MQVFNISKDQLLNGVTTVPDALHKLVIKQAEGYGYIKATKLLRKSSVTVTCITSKGVSKQ